MHTFILSPFTCYTNTLLSACVHAAPLNSPPNFPATAFGVSKIRAKNKENKTLRFEETPKFIDILAGRRDEKEQ